LVVTMTMRLFNRLWKWTETNSQKNLNILLIPTYLLQLWNQTECDFFKVKETTKERHCTILSSMYLVRIYLSKDYLFSNSHWKCVHLAIHRFIPAGFLKLLLIFIYYCNK
jgi:hypothetical protein